MIKTITLLALITLASCATPRSQKINNGSADILKKSDTIRKTVGTAKGNALSGDYNVKTTYQPQVCRKVETPKKSELTYETTLSCTQADGKLICKDGEKISYEGAANKDFTLTLAGSHDMEDDKLGKLKMVAVLGAKLDEKGTGTGTTELLITTAKGGICTQTGKTEWTKIK